MLNYLNKQNLLADIKKFDDSLVKFRNQSTHRNLINIRFSHSLHENVNTGAGTSDRPRVFLIGDENKYFEIIPFLETSLRNAKEWVQVITSSEPCLR
jgi:hypothetical protein